MLFKRISYRIALQFMAFVFVLLLINGLVFLAVDYSNARRQSHQRLSRTLQTITSNWQSGVASMKISLPPPERGRVRILDAFGREIYVGAFFEEIPFDNDEGYSSAVFNGDQYTILTAKILFDGKPAGFIQVADVERFQRGDLPARALLYLIVSVGISAITFAVGLFFARRSLKPAEQMMERLEQFTQDASHELRTPLATLNSSLDLALKTGNYKEGLLSAKDDVKEVTILAERLLELARLDQLSLRREAIDFSSLVQDALDRHGAIAAEHKVTLEGAIAKDIKVHGDAALLRQILSNLLSNAIKFSKPEGGKVLVTLKRDSLSVQDHGIGMAHDTVERMFDRFYRADSSRTKDGFGLGLALVKRIVDLHDWTIAVQSKEGQGTTFVIRFSARASAKKPS